MFAVVHTGGKQYKVSTGDILDVEKLEGKEGDDVELDQVLLTGDEKDLNIGTPLVKESKVTAKIITQGKGPKIVIMKHKQRKGYRKKQGHRQSLTTIEITAIK